ncbi:MAG: hypothetical protein HY669_04585 [Chloroflexi bacterium]|nr:hypothetical protein [Chloroflexota bacterium]
MVEEFFITQLEEKDDLLEMYDVQRAGVAPGQLPKDTGGAVDIGLH